MKETEKIFSVLVFVAMFTLFIWLVQILRHKENPENRDGFGVFECSER